MWGFQAITWKNKKIDSIHTLRLLHKQWYYRIFLWCFSCWSFYSVGKIWQRSNWNNLLKKAITHQHKDGLSPPIKSGSPYMATQAVHCSTPRGTIQIDHGVNGFSRSYAISRPWTSLSHLLRIKSDITFSTLPSPKQPSWQESLPL